MHEWFKEKSPSEKVHMDGLNCWFTFLFIQGFETVVVSSLFLSINFLPEQEQCKFSNCLNWLTLPIRAYSIALEEFPAAYIKKN